MRGNRSHLRLVVDNSSSSDNEMPFSRASRSNGKWCREGISPRQDQLAIPEFERSSKLATLSGPPNRSRISVTKDVIEKVISRNGSFVNPDTGVILNLFKPNPCVTNDSYRRENNPDMGDKILWPEFAKRLRLARKARGFKSAKKFAIECDFKVGTYGNWERGTRSPGPDDMAKLARAGISIYYLILGDGPMVDETFLSRRTKIA